MPALELKPHCRFPWLLCLPVADVDPARREQLIELLDIDLRWRMHRVSDGQRRRVQICMNLLRPFQVCQPHTSTCSVLLSYRDSRPSEIRVPHDQVLLLFSVARLAIPNRSLLWLLRGCCESPSFATASAEHSLPCSVLLLLTLQVLLLDEVTVDLDVVARMDLLQFFKEECEQVRSWLLAADCVWHSA